MASVRASRDQLEDTAALLLRRDVDHATGGNALLSKPEQAVSPEHVQDAAEELRRQGGSGTRVESEALNALLTQKVSELITSVNQRVGVGRRVISKAEARAAKAKNPALGERVMKAWEIVTGRSADVDGIAEAHARGFGDAESSFRVFGSEAIAENYQDPRGRSLLWLVKTGEDAQKASYVWGRNDLWAERFDVDVKTGALVITGEH